MSDVRKTVERLMAEGWSVVPIMAGKKQPTDDGWLKRRYTLDDFPEGCNVGVKNGEPSGWRVDVDLDAMAAVSAAQTLLPATGLIHGRPGKPQSHWWFISPGTATRAYKDVDGTMLVELRSSGGQTVIPPSRHHSGDVLEWTSNRNPMTIATPDLLHAVRAVAIAALFARHWPTGSRHFAALHLSGFLLRLGFDGPWTERIVLCAAQGAKDEEAQDRARTARDTAKAHANGGKTTGGPKLAESFGRGEELAALCYRWMEREGDDWIDRLNDRHFVGELGPEIVVGTEVDDATPADFQDFEQFRKRYYNQYVGKQKLGEFWLAHPKRRTLRKIVFAPPPLTCHPEDYNLWRGFAVAPDKAANPEQRCARFIEHLFEVICNGDDQHFAFLIDTLALTVQRPGAPTGVAVVLRGDPGAGKGTFVDSFGRLFGPHYLQVDKQTHVTGRFNQHLSGKVVLFADEAVWGGDKREIGALRRLVTERTLTIERKYLDATSEPNCIHLFMATNEDWVWPTSLRERRGFILDVEKKQHCTRDYFNAVHAEWEQGGAQAFLAVLQAHQVPGNRLGALPTTAALEHQQNLSLDTLHIWWKDKLLNGEFAVGQGWPEFIPTRTMWEDYGRAAEATGTRRRVLEMVLAEQFRKIVPPSAQRARRYATVNTASYGTPNLVTARVMGWVMPSLASCRQFFDRLTGIPTNWPEVEPQEQELPRGDI